MIRWFRNFCKKPDTREEITLDTGSSLDEGGLSFDGTGHAEAPGTLIPDPEHGSIRIDFTQRNHDGAEPQVVVFRDTGGDPQAGHFDISVSKDGMVILRHKSGEDTHFFVTEPGFFSPGDKVSVDYSWDRGGKGGQFVAQNTTTGDSYREPVPGHLGFDPGEDGSQPPLVLGALRHDLDGETYMGRHFDGWIEELEVTDTPFGAREAEAEGGDDDADLAAAEAAETEGDTILGTPGTDTLEGGEGDDSIVGSGGDDLLIGGAGNDTLVGDGGPQVAVRDLIVNGSFEDTSGMKKTFYGYVSEGEAPGWTTAAPEGNEAGIDFHSDGRGGLDAPDGSNWADLGASPGNIRLGQDVQGVMEGESYTLSFMAGDKPGAGNSFKLIWNGEVVEIDGQTVITPPAGEFASYTVTLIGGTGDGSNRLEFQGLGPEDNYGVAIDDVRLIGPTEIDTGAAGNDTLIGGPGDDLMFGGPGDDTFVLEDGFGQDSIFGGDDGETLGDLIDGSALTDDAEVIFSGDGDGTLSAGGSNALFEGIERIETGSGDDLIDARGAQVGLWMSSGAGNDTLFGGAGDDTLLGGAGDDVIVAGGGSNLIDAGDGDDVIFAGPGDTIDGGEGFDVLVLNGGKPVEEVVVTSSVPGPGGRLSQDGYVTYSDGSPPTVFKNVETVVHCFTPGTRIATAGGTKPVEEITAGDLVLTRDRGLRPVSWAGRCDLTGADLAADPRLAPVHISAGALGGGLPERDMEVSPQHRILFAGPRAELMFGHPEVLVVALHLVGLPGITRRAAGAVSYIHFMFDRHEIVRADGAWSESFQPGERTLAGLDAPQREELLRLFPELARPEGRVRYGAARMTLKRHEALVLSLG